MFSNIIFWHNLLAKRSLTNSKEEQQQQQQQNDFTRLKNLLEQSRFLSDKKLETALQDRQLDSCGMTLICMDNVLNALGIDSMDGVRQLQSTHSDVQHLNDAEDACSTSDVSCEPICRAQDVGNLARI